MATKTAAWAACGSSPRRQVRYIPVAHPKVAAVRRRARRDLTRWSTKGELARLILILAIPVAATNLLQALIGFVDVRMVSVLGKEALSSLAVGRQSMWLVSAIFMGLGAGITAHVARFTGAKDYAKARAYATTGIVSAMIIGLALTALALVIGRHPVEYMVSSETGEIDAITQALTQRYAWDYMRVLFIGLIGVGAQFACVSIFNSLGRTLYPMWLLVIANVANFAGNWLLIPRYEVAGCAWSTTLTTLVVSATAITLLTRQRAAVWSTELIAAFMLRAWEMLKLGFPAALQVAARSLAALTLLKVITYLPNTDSVVGQSAFFVGLMAESLAFMPALAFSIAASTMVGQNLGARRPDQAHQGALFCLLFSELIMWSMGSLLFLFPQWFIWLFIGSNSPEAFDAAANFLRILALCLPGLAIGMTMSGALRGAGDTRAAAAITLTSMWLVRIPLAAMLSLNNIFGSGIGFGLGLDGVWWAMTGSVYVEATLAYLRFRSGAWARIKLAEE